MGRGGERRVAEQLIERGWYVIPSYDYSGEDDHAPRMEGRAGCYILPDLDISKGGKRRWAEVKTKTEAAFFYKTSELVHGIPVRHLEHYRRVEAESGCEVWLFIYEISTAALLYSKLSELGEGQRYTGRKMSNGGMVFWPRNTFRIWHFD
jgi:hypothetical protein